MPVDARDRGLGRALATLLPTGLAGGEVGYVLARAGVGKSALLVRVALERLLRSERVLHVAVRDSVAHVRDAYDSVLSGLLAPNARPLDRAEALLVVERHRLVHATRGEPVDVARLERVLGDVETLMDFRPALLVIDGAPPPADLRAFARRHGVPVWVAWTPPDTAVDLDGADVVIEMTADGANAWLHARKLPGAELPPSVRVAGFVGRDPGDPAGGPPARPGDCTLYSGGAAGAEAAFGAAAERVGVREVNFTFDGHVQVRARGAHPLTEQELAQGDVSLAYVSRRLRRSYGESAQIKRVLQSLWHMVSQAQQVFVVGAIREDGTVSGGTGWSVELARMWNKRLWVYDQEKDGWYRWVGDTWMEGTPVVDATTICGTGTRSLTAAGRQAVDALFDRSFRGSPG